jgi:tetratricopeptide (TPR) repeat protein
MIKKLVVIFSVLSLFPASNLFSEIIVLKSGKTVEGKIVERTDKVIKVDMEGIPLTYYFDDINTIDGKAVQPIQKSKGLQNIDLTPSKINDIMGRKNFVDTTVLVDNEQLGTFLNIGASLAQAGRHQEAIVEYEKALQINPNFGTAYLNMGGSYRYLGNNQKAIECFQKALAIDPNDVNALNNLAAVYAESNKLDEAIIYFKKAIEIDPNNALFHEGLGLAHVKLGQYKEASECFQKAIEKDSKDPVFYYELGLAYFSLHDYEQAKKNFLTAKNLHKTLGKTGSTAYIDNALGKIP